MKTINNILLILCIFGNGILFSQIDPEVKTINNPLQPSTVTSPIRTKMDELNRDLTDGRRDDPTLYYSSGINRAGSNDSIRLVYFLHGLGGNETSWGVTYNAHVNKYRYKPYRPDYYGNQHSFLTATDEAHTEMGVKLSSYRVNYPSQYDTIARPYVIAHSLGGLVARDMDMKHDSADLLDRTMNPANRRFWGLVTFGTSHAGAAIVGNQQELAQLGADLAGKILTTELNGIIDNLITGLPKIAQTFIGTSGLSSAPSKLGTYFADSLGARILTQLTKDNTDPIGKQFTPTSTYLVDTLNQYINPKLAKALFWGEEEDPILWRMAYYLVNGPNTFPAFGANEDGEMAVAMEKMRVDAKAWSIVYQGFAGWHHSVASKWWNIGRGWGKSNSHMVRYGVTSSISRDLKALENELTKVNLKYKAILGAVDEDNLYRTDTTGWKCIRIIVSRRHPRDGGGIQTSRTVNYVATPSLCNTSTPSGSSNIIRDHTVVVPITTTTLLEVPSDATVLASSAKAFPGCNNLYKNFMGPVQLPDGTWSKGRVNHLQMRNCSETDWALQQVYNGNDVNIPKFFRLHKW